MTRSPILGVGIDLVENSRMAEVLERWGERFRGRVFLAQERRYCDSKAFPAHHYAGRFAVKEAVAKAFGTGVGESIGWLDIEVVKDVATGAPSVELGARAQALARERGAREVLVSLAHTRNYAVAQALLLA